MTRLTRESTTKIALIIAFGALVIGLVGLGGWSGCAAFGARFETATEQGNASIDAQEVESLDIGWGAGDARVVVVDDADANGRIELVETLVGSAPRGQQMRWGVSGGTLHVEQGSGFSCSALFGRRDLEVRIPKSAAERFDAVRLSGASGSFSAEGIGCRALDVELASGEMDVRGVRAEELAVDVASGGMNVAGEFGRSVRLKTASGEARVSCEGACPQDLVAEVASGSAVVALPEGSGFTARVDKASGSFRSDFPSSQGAGGGVVGDGSASFDIFIASGSFAIEKS